MTILTTDTIGIPNDVTCIIAFAFSSDEVATAEAAVFVFCNTRVASPNGSHFPKTCPVRRAFTISMIEQTIGMRVFITGTGMVSPRGVGREELGVGREKS
ncbi:MAG: Unknown protein [uncultured Thiotrichaceae bacterium]|uniref:Uncharacterized protein n=1 Tax=uncultured Thiotrichaceae bacterium TaxID=298394 RepID=A0A6S6T3S4_9GAMM|nr:MAG: Unknown protein [uncultured Thiotrichaceae bacterium]